MEKTTGLTTGQPDNAVFYARAGSARVRDRSIDPFRWRETSQGMSVTRDRSRDEARRDWLHVSGMPRIRGVALDSAPSSPPRGYRFLLHLLATTIVL